MEIAGAIIFAPAISIVVYAGITHELTILCSLAVAAPLVVAGALALFGGKGKRALRVELIACAMFISLALTLNCMVNRMAPRESVRELMLLAEARGYTSTPVFYMLTDDRTGEFYAGGRLAYKANGEPFRFDGADEAAAAARERGGAALVFVPTEWENKLTDYRQIETEVIGSNGVLTLAAIRVR